MLDESLKRKVHLSFSKPTFAGRKLFATNLLTFSPPFPFAALYIKSIYYLLILFYLVQYRKMLSGIFVLANELLISFITSPRSDFLALLLLCIVAAFFILHVFFRNLFKFNTLWILKVFHHHRFIILVFLSIKKEHIVIMFFLLKIFNQLKKGV